MNGCSVVSEFVNATVPAAAQHDNGGKPYQTETAANQRARTDLPSPELLRQLLEYDPETGALSWKPRPVSMFKTSRAAKAWNARFAGKPAFTAGSHGYRAGTILGLSCLGHRVARAIHFGEWPGSGADIDHINGRRDDNRIANLRVVSRAENLRNQRRRANNASGVMGVSWHSPSKKWLAQIGASGRLKHLGYFTDFDVAVAARKAAEAVHGYSPNHGRDA